LLIAMSIR